MGNQAKDCRSTVIPGLRYRNAMAMIDWLCDNFGFTRQAVFAGKDDFVEHAQLTFGNGMIMIGSIRDDTHSATPIKQPDEIGGAETQSPYLIVSDCDALYAKAKAGGASITMDLKEMDYGGKAFSCRDPEGHVWHFGTYDPWAAGGSGSDALA